MIVNIGNGKTKNPQIKKLSLLQRLGVVALGVPALGDLKVEEEAGDTILDTVVLLGECRLARGALKRGDRRVATRGKVFGVLGKPGGGRRGEGRQTKSGALLAP